MLRVRLVTAATFAAIAIGSLQLGGCSGSSSSLVQSSPPPAQPLRFESVPPGAEVSTPDGQTCKTPCSLAVPLAAQAVNFTLSGYSPQTVPVQVHRDSIFSPAVFVPDPVTATLAAAAKPKPRAPHPKPMARPTAAAPAAPAATPAPAAAPPRPSTTTQDTAFPPPPATQSPVESRFPTPAQQLPQVR